MPKYKIKITASLQELRDYLRNQKIKFKGNDSRKALQLLAGFTEAQIKAQDKKDLAAEKEKAKTAEEKEKRQKEAKKNLQKELNKAQAKKDKEKNKKKELEEKRKKTKAESNKFEKLKNDFQDKFIVDCVHDDDSNTYMIYSTRTKARSNITRHGIPKEDLIKLINQLNAGKAFELRKQIKKHHLFLLPKKKGKGKPKPKK